MAGTLIANRLLNIQSEIATAAAQARRDPSDVLLIAVSKKKTTEDILAALGAGVHHFGENYLQEAVGKINAIPLEDRKLMHWHFIGRLQSNKIKKITGQFEYIHSVDSLRMADEIDQAAAGLGLRQKVLMQVNLAEEGTKAGFLEKELLDQWESLIRLQNIEIAGLMTMPPLGLEPEASRPFFARLRILQQYLHRNTLSAHHPMDQLSMGTSHDFTVAVEEGATMVRLGTVVFGERER